MMMVMPSNHSSIVACSKSLWGTVSLIPVGKKIMTKVGLGYILGIFSQTLLVTLPVKTTGM
jgi:hypothetical protein